MEKKIRYTLGKNERLKSRKAIDQLFSKGQSFSLFPFRVLYQKSSGNNETPALLAAFTVSKRHFKKAVYRNRVKRLMREAYRLQKNELQNDLLQHNQQVVVFILYTGTVLPEYNLVKEKMRAIIKRLQKSINEETAATT